MPFIARPNAATYPDAVHNAPAMPKMNAKIAPEDMLNEVKVGFRVVATPSAPASRRMPSSVFTVCSP